MKNLSHEGEVNMLNRNKLLPPLKNLETQKKSQKKPIPNSYDLKKINLYSGDYIHLKD